jgi:hypothetical protein
MGTLVLVVLVLVGGALYVVACSIWPYTACGRCDGGKRRSPSGKAWRSCPRCKGSGKRRRFGAGLDD